jgi:hypothetical protein
VKTRKLLIVILAVALLAVYYLLGSDYLKQRHEHEALASEIAGANRTLSEIPAPPADLEQRLTDAQAGLCTANETLPEPLNSTRIINVILRLADETGVKAIPLVTQPWTVESIGEVNMSVFRLNIAVKGTFSQVSGFLDRLENGETETLVMEYATIDSITAPFGGEGVQDDTAQVDARFDIAVYSRAPAIEVDEEGE